MSRHPQTGPLLLVNASHPLPISETPDLVCADPRWPEVQLDRQAAGQLRACIRAVKGENAIVPVSGWRSLDQQQAIWDDTMRKEGEAFTRQYVARPGCSEHQTGLAIDLGLAAETIDFIQPNFPHSGVCGAFRKLAACYGFVLRYPAGKESITGIAHEPWHFRYVGTPHARFMTDQCLVLEEYVELLRQKHSKQPLFVPAGARTYRIRSCSEPCREDLDAASEGRCQISPDNCGGYIVTDWR